jgi:hypothetical protein
MLTTFVITVIGSWYAAAWIKNGWWLWLIVPALPVAAIFVLLIVNTVNNPEAPTALLMAADALGIVAGTSVGLIVGIAVAIGVRWSTARSKSKHAA